MRFEYAERSEYEDDGGGGCSGQRSLWLKQSCGVRRLEGTGPGFQSSSDPESCRLLGRSLTIPASIAGSRKQNIIGDPLGPSQLSNNMTTSITIMGKEE